MMEEEEEVEVEGEEGSSELFGWKEGRGKEVIRVESSGQRWSKEGLAVAPPTHQTSSSPYLVTVYLTLADFHSGMSTSSRITLMWTLRYLSSRYVLLPPFGSTQLAGFKPKQPLLPTRATYGPLALVQLS